MINQSSNGVIKKILLKDYAASHGRTSNAATRKACRGGFQTAEKIGRQWFIDPSEPWEDYRVKSGKYVGWRKDKKDSRKT